MTGGDEVGSPEERSALRQHRLARRVESQRSTLQVSTCETVVSPCLSLPLSWLRPCLCVAVLQSELGGVSSLIQSVMTVRP